jgi:hypothetical protein
MLCTLKAAQKLWLAAMTFSSPSSSSSGSLDEATTASAKLSAG